MLKGACDRCELHSRTYQTLRSPCTSDGESGRQKRWRWCHWAIEEITNESGLRW